MITLAYINILGLMLGTAAIGIAAKGLFKERLVPDVAMTMAVIGLAISVLSVL